MKILYISNFSTTSCRTGAEWRSHWLRSALEKMGEVETIEVIDRRLERHVGLKYVWTVIIRKLCPQATFPYYLNAFKRDIVRGRTFDAIVVRYSAVAGALGVWESGIPCFLDIDDMPIQLCKTKLQKYICGLWQRWLYRKMRGCWVANRDHVKIVNPYAKCYALPNIANSPSKIVSADFTKPVLLTVGSLLHSPNVEGIDSFLFSEWAKIRKACPDAEYWIVGGGCPDEMRNRWEKLAGVRVLGFVDDISKIYAQSRAVVCPIYSGSGTCIKTVEAVLHGRICIGSDFAFRGWTREQKECMFVKICGRNLSETCVSVLQSTPVDAQQIHDWGVNEFGVEEFNRLVEKCISEKL